MAQTYGREEIKAGTVVLGSLAVLVVLIVLVSRGGFQSTPLEYRIEFASVGGLEEGAQVVSTIVGEDRLDTAVGSAVVSAGGGWSSLPQFRLGGG